MLIDRGADCTQLQDSSYRSLQINVVLPEKIHVNRNEVRGLHEYPLGMNAARLAELETQYWQMSTNNQAAMVTYYHAIIANPRSFPDIHIPEELRSMLGGPRTKSARKW